MGQENSPRVASKSQSGLSRPRKAASLATSSSLLSTISSTASGEICVGALAAGGSIRSRSHSRAFTGRRGRTQVLVRGGQNQAAPPGTNGTSGARLVEDSVLPDLDTARIEPDGVHHSGNDLRTAGVILLCDDDADPRRPKRVQPRLQLPPVSTEVDQRTVTLQGHIKARLGNHPPGDEVTKVAYGPVHGIANQVHDLRVRRDVCGETSDVVGELRSHRVPRRAVYQAGCSVRISVALFIEVESSPHISLTPQEHRRLLLRR